jgi:hypothetical protein|uniref:DUF2007 domain-containing protein n=1 Tax=candidate division WOR-3 bacterium TaxID=2052148 RepID=A0A7C3UVR1_UNCW3
MKLLYKPKDESEALLLKHLLESKGIKVFLKSYQIPWYDGLAMVMRPEWGEIQVAEEDFPEAEEILKDFFIQKEKDDK